MKTTSIIFVLFWSLNSLFSQSLLITDVDASNFPNMKAKFYAFDKDWYQIINLSESDFLITEDGNPRTVTKVSCPQPKQPNALSSVLVMDASGSMKGNNLNLAKVAAKVWIETIPLGYSECAITAFDNNNYMVQDFSTDKNILLQNVNTLFAGGGTNYDAALLYPPYGGLIISKTGKNKKVIVFLTDGLPQSEPQITNIINEANRQNCIIYSVVLGMHCPESLKEISMKTGGLWFENIKNEDEIVSVYQKILIMAQENSPCEISWISGKKCNKLPVQVNIKYVNFDISRSFSYPAQISSVENLDFSPFSIFFKNAAKGIQWDTILNVNANNLNLNVTNIISTNPDFKISPTSFNIQNGESIDLIVSFTPSDSSYTFTEFIFEDDSPCGYKYFAAGGFSGISPNKKTLKVIHPNGGEKFAVGTDTLITWEGIMLEDSVTIEYSIDNGSSWNIITKYATGLQYLWKNVPKPTSDECLIRVQQIAKDISSDSLPTILWTKSYGGSLSESMNKIIPAHDGGYILSGNSFSKDGDLINNNGQGEIWIVKIDDSGNIIWQKLFSKRHIAYSSSISKTSDGGYIILGNTDSLVKDYNVIMSTIDIWVVKIDMYGNLLWEKSYGYNYYDYANDIIETNDGGFVIIGQTNGLDEETYIKNNKSAIDNLIIKINRNGEIEWQKNYGGSSDESLAGICQSAEGGFVAVGFTSSTDFNGIQVKGQSDIQILKTNSKGEIEWIKTYGGTKSEQAIQVIQLPNFNYLIGGHTESNDGDVIDLKGLFNSIWILELSPDGSLIRQNTYGGNWDEKLQSLAICNNGDILFSGSTRSAFADFSSNKGVEDYWAVKTDKIGGVIWKRNLGGSSFDYSTSIIESNDGGFMVGGYSRSTDFDVHDNHLDYYTKEGSYDYWVVKLSSDINYLQSDESDSVFSIVEPIPSAKDVDMGKSLVGKYKDSVVINFITNLGGYKFTVDSIYFTGADAQSFSLVSGIPPFDVESKSGYNVELSFIPIRIGIHNALINIITRSGTLEFSVQGEGIQPLLGLVTEYLDFGKVGVFFVKDSLKILAVKNIGDVDIVVKDIKIIQNQNFNFSILSGADDAVLRAGDTLFLDLRFQPKFAGYQNAYIEFNYDGFDSPLKMNLYGQGVIDGEISARLEVLDAEAYPMKNVKVYIRALENNYLEISGINSLKAELNFNPTLLAPLDYTAKITDDKNAKIILDSLSVNFKAGDTIAVIWFRVGLGNAESCKLTLSNVETVGGVAEIEVIDGTFKLLGICYEGGKRLINPNNKVELLQISPNPNDGNLAVELNLIEEDSSTLSIYNSNGQLMYEQNITGTTGKMDLNIDTKLYGNGLYFVSLQTPTIRKVKQMVVFK